MMCEVHDNSTVDYSQVEAKIGEDEVGMIDHCLCTLMSNVRMLEACTRKEPIRDEHSRSICLEAARTLQRIGTYHTQHSSRGLMREISSTLEEKLKKQDSAARTHHSTRLSPGVMDVMMTQQKSVDPRAKTIRRESTCRQSLTVSDYEDLDSDSDSGQDADSTHHREHRHHSCSNEVMETTTRCNQTAETYADQSLAKHNNKDKIQKLTIDTTLPAQRAFINSGLQRKKRDEPAIQRDPQRSERREAIVGKLRSGIHAISMAKQFQKVDVKKVMPQIVMLPRATNSKRYLQSQHRLRRERNALINSLVDESVQSDAIWMIHPEQYELMFWNALLLLLWILSLLAIPISFAFNAEAPSWSIVCIDSLFILDIGIGFITGYIDGPIVCMNSKKVASRYLRTCFFWDIIAAVPFGALCLLHKPSNSTARLLLHLLELGKCVKVPKLNREVIRPLTERAIDCHMISRVTLGLLQILGWFGVILHWLGCCYWYISYYTEPDWKVDREYSENTWVRTAAYKRGFCPHYTLHNRYVSRKWLASIHWAAYATYSGLPLRQGTIPLKTVQSTFQTLCLMLGMLVLASTIGAVGAVIDELRGGDRHKQDMLNELDHFFTVRNVPEDVRITIRRYILFLHERRILTSSSPTKQILSQLPSELRSHVIGGAKFSYLKAPGQFYALFDDNFLRVVSYRMCTAIYHPLQIACSQGEPCAGVQYVAKGSVLLFVRSQPWPKALRFLEHNETFGEEIFLLDRTDRYLDDEEPECLYSAVARDFTEVFLLRCADLIELRILYPEFRKVFDDIANQSRNALCFEVASKILRKWCKKHVLRKRSPYTGSAYLPVAASRSVREQQRISIETKIRDSRKSNRQKQKKKIRSLNNRLSAFGTVATHHCQHASVISEYS